MHAPSSAVQISLTIIIWNLEAFCDGFNKKKETALFNTALNILNSSKNSIKYKWTTCCSCLSSNGIMKFEAGIPRTRVWSANHQTVTFVHRYIANRLHFLKFIALNESNKNSERSTFRVLHYRITEAFFISRLSTMYIFPGREDPNTKMRTLTLSQWREEWEKSSLQFMSLFSIPFLSPLPAFVYRSSCCFKQPFLCLFQILYNTNTFFFV